MTNVEHIYAGFQWADPEGKSLALEVKPVGTELQITGLLPLYEHPDQPSDLIRQYERAAKSGVVGKKRTGKNSPDMLFANADTDEKLVAFVRRFGPVVAKDACTKFEELETGALKPRRPLRLSAVQDMQELRNERSIYHSAVALIAQVNEPGFDYQRAQSLIGTIAAKIADWPRTPST